MKWITVLLMAFCAMSAEAQEATILTKKDIFNIQEEIKVEYVISASDIDSVSRPHFRDLTIRSGPSKFGTSRWLNGVTTKEYKVTYLLKADGVGIIALPELYFYVGGRAIGSGERSIQVTDAPLSDQSKKELQRSDIQSFPFSPEGTVQIVFLDDFGYYKIRQANGAVDIELTENQIMMIREILKLNR